MPRALSKFYNWRTSFWYRWLHRPIRMHVTIDNKATPHSGLFAWYFGYIRDLAHHNSPIFRQF